MQGSVMPRRWIISLALVGLVSLLAAVYPSVWSGPASAATPPSTLPADNAASCEVNATGFTVNAGTTVSLSVNIKDGNGVVNNNLVGLSFEWLTSGGSLGSPTSRTTTYTAPSSGGTFFVDLTVRQEQFAGPTLPTLPDLRVVCTFPSGGHTITVTVTTPGPAATATPLPVNPPGAIPTITTTQPNTNISVVTPAQGGSVTSSSNPNIQVNVPPGAVTGFAGIQVTTVTSAAAPAPAANLFKFGSTVVDVKFTDAAGVPLASFTAGVPVEVCLPYTDADAAGALGGTQGLGIWRYNALAGAWVPLVTRIDPIAKRLCTSTSQFSVFAVGLAPIPPTATPAPAGTATAAPQATATPVRTPTPGAKLPVTGDYTPGGSGLMIAALVGLAFVGIGVIAMRRSRRSSAR